MISHGFGFDKRYTEQILRLRRQRAETILQLVAHCIRILDAPHGSDPFVDIQLLHFVDDILRRDIGIDIQIDGAVAFDGFRLPLLFPHGFLQHLAIQIVAYALDVSVLLFAQQRTGAADLQVTHRDLETAAQFGKFPDRRQTLLCHFLQHLVALVHQECIAGTVGTSYTPAQLIQLRKPQLVGIVNDHGIDIRDIQTGLNDGRRYQYIDLFADETQHDIFQFTLLHLSVRISHTCFRHQLRHHGRHILDVIYPVIDIVHLAAAVQLSLHGFAYHFFIKFADIGLDRLSVERRFFQKAHITYAYETHMQGTRDRRRRQGQYIHIAAQLLDLFLMRHTEALFLIDDEQSQIRIDHILGQEPVCADHDIHQAALQILERFFDLRRRAETGKHLDTDRILRHTFAEGIEMLFRKDRGRHQIRHLLAFLYRLECSADRHFGLAEAHIPADQTVHDLFAFHIVLGGIDGIQLVFRFLIREKLLKLFLPYRILAELVAVSLAAQGI